jgi:hypothetical protein
MTEVETTMRGGARQRFSVQLARSHSNRRRRLPRDPRQAGSASPLPGAGGRKLVAEETERWAKVIKFADIKPE